jgi:hypothetical protein
MHAPSAVPGGDHSHSWGPNSKVPGHSIEPYLVPTYNCPRSWHPCLPSTVRVSDESQLRCFTSPCRSSVCGPRPAASEHPCSSLPTQDDRLSRASSSDPSELRSSGDQSHYRGSGRTRGSICPDPRERRARGHLRPADGKAIAPGRSARSSSSSTGSPRRAQKASSEVHRLRSRTLLSVRSASASPL